MNIEKKTITVKKVERLTPTQQVIEYANIKGEKKWFLCPQCKKILNKTQLQGTLEKGYCKSCFSIVLAGKFQLQEKDLKTCLYCSKKIEGIESDNQKTKYHKGCAAIAKRNRQLVKKMMRKFEDIRLSSKEIKKIIKIAKQIKQQNEGESNSMKTP